MSGIILLRSGLNTSRFVFSKVLDTFWMQKMGRKRDLSLASNLLRDSLLRVSQLFVTLGHVRYWLLDTGE